jgi:hypothetical protein
LNILINVLTRTRNAGGDTLIAGSFQQRAPALRGHQARYGLHHHHTVDEAVAKLQA